MTACLLCKLKHGAHGRNGTGLCEDCAYAMNHDISRELTPEQKIAINSVTKITYPVVIHYDVDERCVIIQGYGQGSTRHAVERIYGLYGF